MQDLEYDKPYKEYNEITRLVKNLDRCLRRKKVGNEQDAYDIIKEFKDKALAEHETEIRINNYTISKYDSESIWISQDDGEGQQLILKEFWKDF